MLVTMEKGYHYKLKLTDGTIVEGEAVFFRVSTTPQERPIVLKTKDGVIQIDSKLVETCEGNCESVG